MLNTHVSSGGKAGETMPMIHIFCKYGALLTRCCTNIWLTNTVVLDHVGKIKGAGLRHASRTTGCNRVQLVTHDETQALIIAGESMLDSEQLQGSATRSSSTTRTLRMSLLNSM